MEEQVIAPCGMNCGVCASYLAMKNDLKKKGLESFKVSAPRARYPNAQLYPKGEWLIIAGIPIPDNTTSLPQKEPGTEVKIENWRAMVQTPKNYSPSKR
jgi:hypothetical protein